MIGFIIGAVFSYFYEKAYKSLSKWEKHPAIVLFEGYHLHHSLYGIALIGAFFYLRNFYLLGAGISIIIRPTTSERKFTFIEKVKKS